MPKRPRDSQRSKVYRADNVVPEGRRLRSLPECQEYINGMLRKAWFKNRWPWVAKRGVHVGFQRGSTWARGHFKIGFGGTMNLPLWARTEATILHELAHVCSTEERIRLREPRRAAHGLEYANILLQLVTWKMGSDVGRDLRKSYREHRVKWYRRNGHA